MKRIIIILALAALSPREAVAQQDPMVSQYMFNGLYLNPAYAGSHDYWSSTLSFRSQWVGFDGAPMTESALVEQQPLSMTKTLSTRSNAL